MAMKKYRWRGYTYKIADEDLAMYPGAIPVEEKATVMPETKVKEEPKNKKRKPAKNKSQKGK